MGKFRLRNGLATIIYITLQFKQSNAGDSRNKTMPAEVVVVTKLQTKSVQLDQLDTTRCKVHTKKFWLRLYTSLVNWESDIGK